MGDIHGFHGANGCAKCVEAGWKPPTPTSDMVSIPTEKVDALRRAVMLWGPDYTHPLANAARAVVDAVETEDEDWPFTKERPRHLWEGNFTPAPSPARDDAEKGWEERITADFQKHPGSWRPDPENWFREGWLAGYATHMAAPDELTDNDRLKQIVELQDQNTALRERLADLLAHEPKMVDGWWRTQIKALL